MRQLILCSVMIAASSAVFADTGRGKTLHDENCMKCHDTGVYTREDRFIRDRAALDKQVQRCQLNVGAQWFDEDTEAVVQYLDESFYKFK